ncbi:MAG: PfkB family carbohydrate kinase [Gammaproteobacteria bacterium]|nr:PfkB family carbohydrate kinase [Gammaproteobacteria bacterium]
MNENQGVSLAFGEVLFDRFKGQDVLGGAPLNFAWHLRQFGHRTAMVSAVGKDQLGAEARTFLTQADIDQSQVADRPEATGTVDVSLEGGEPTYVIHENVAWDHIELRDAALEQPDLVYFGTLAQRTEGNRETLRKLLATAPRHRLCDINLRVPFHSDSVVLDSLHQATIVKLNDAEWPIVQQLTRLPTPIQLLDRFDLEMVAMTRGEAGAVLYFKDEIRSASASSVPVVDTVGAGDAFCAALAAGTLADADPVTILAVACDAGAAIVQQRGGQGQLPDAVTRAYS